MNLICGGREIRSTSQEFADMTANALKILKYANSMEVYELTEAIKTLTADKNNINDYLDIFQFWFRDVLMFKATREIDNLVFKQEINFIREQASERSYENIEKILEPAILAQYSAAVCFAPVMVVEIFSVVRLMIPS